MAYKTVNDLIAELQDIADEYDMGDTQVHTLTEGGFESVITGVDVDEDSVWLSVEEAE